MIRVFKTAHAWRSEHPSGTVGFVPTMGALHEGHLSLVARALSENDHALVSIFVNPTQFDQAHDLEGYPRTFEADLAMLASLDPTGRRISVFSPEARELYADEYRYRISENDLSRSLCGAHRPGHFDGVLTVVMKLLQIAGARRAYFGEKDYQQYLLVRGMAEAFFLETEIVGCPTRRESDGLAMSSRNRLLRKQDRARAVEFPRALLASTSAQAARAALEAQGFEVDYVEDRGRRRFGAVRMGKVRLIDNVDLESGSVQ